MVPDPSVTSNKEVNENLARPMDDIRGVIHGRGIGKFNQISVDCICSRPYSHIMCLNCGHLMFGRVRYGCPKHKMVTFLIDITNCPKCKAFEYMLEEFTMEGTENTQENNNNLGDYDEEEENEDL